MMNDSAMQELIREIQAQGIDRETAGHYAALIGDTPVVDPAGNVIVMDGDQVIATLSPLPIFQAN